MSFKPQESNLKLPPKSYIGLQTHRFFSTNKSNNSMDTRVRKPHHNAPLPPSTAAPHPTFQGVNKQPSYLQSSTSMKNSKKRSSYFSIESLFLLLCLTASLLILPLVLPPLPPPPFLLLLLPIGILALLMILAFMPSNVRNLTYTYM